MFKLTRNTSKNKIIHSWIVSYGTILLIPVLVFFVFYFAYNRAVQMKVNTYYNEIIMGVSKQIREILNEHTQMMKFVSSSELMTEALMLDNYSPEGERYYKLIQLMGEIKNYTNSTRLQQNTYVYLKNLDMVVSSQEIAPSRTFYNMYYSDNNSMRYTQWLEKISYGPSDYSIFTAQNNDVHFFDIMLLPTESRYDKKASFVIDINYNGLKQSINAENNIELEYVVAGNKGNVFLVSDNISLDDAKALIRNDIDSDTVKLGGEKYFIKSYSDSETGYNYYCMMPYNKTIGEFRVLGFVGGFLIVLVGVICIMMVYKIANKNYEPLRRLISIIPVSNNGDEFDEYEMITRTFGSIVEQNAKYDRFIKDNSMLKRNDCLARILKYSVGGSFDYDLLDIKFIGKKFSIALFSFEDIGLFGEDENITEEQKNDTLQFIMKNVAEEYTATLDVAGYIVNVDGNMTLLMNFRDSDENAENKSRQIAGFMHDFFHDMMKIEFIVALSGMYVGQTNIHLAYNEAMNIMDDNMIYNFGEAVLSQSSKHLSQRPDYFYSMIKEQMLIDTIKQGDFEAVSKQISEIFDSIRKDNPSKLVCRCYIDDIIGTLFKAELPNEEYAVPLSILNWVNMESFEINVLQYVKKLCDGYKGLTQDSKRIEEVIAEYIEENYRDINLNVNRIAQEFNLNRSYISTVFKKKSGVNLLDYINRCRLEHAKRLLSETDYTVDKIAEKVGYAEGRTLIRVFKKYTDITPNQYRKSLKFD